LKEIQEPEKEQKPQQVEERVPIVLTKKPKAEPLLISPEPKPTRATEYLRDQLALVPDNNKNPEI
jgi:hypothetical protein